MLIFESALHYDFLQDTLNSVISYAGAGTLTQKENVFFVVDLLSMHVSFFVVPVLILKSL